MQAGETSMGSGPPGPHQAKTITRLVALMASCLAAALVLNGLFTIWSVQNFKRQEQQNGIIVQRKICKTLDLLYREKPPSGDASKNPSRAYEQDLHARFADLRIDLGCVR